MANPITQIILTAVDKTKETFASVENGLKSLAAKAIAITGTALSIRGIADMADEYANLQSRLKLASRNQEEFNQANEDLKRISTDAKVPLSETAQLYTRIAASVKDLGTSQELIADTTEAVALSLKISGASAAESSSAMLQFSQAMASGVLRGEEFNAINESAPRLLQALAKSLDVPVGSLREMAKQGKLTRDVIINGLLKELPQLQKEAATLPDTIGSTFTSLKNQIMLAVGALDESQGVVKGFSETLSKVGKTGIEALAVTGANVVFVFKAIGREIGGIVAQLSALISRDWKAFGFISEAMKKDAAEARKELDAFEKKMLGTDRSTNEERQRNSNETTDVIVNNLADEAKEYKKTITEELSDTERLKSAILSAWQAQLSAQKDYANQAKRLRDEANAVPKDSTVEGQALAMLELIAAEGKLQRLRNSAPLEDVQAQAQAVRDKAAMLDDEARAQESVNRSKLAEADALDRAAVAAGNQAAALNEQGREAERRALNMKGALDGIGKEVSVDITTLPSVSKSKQDLTDIVNLLDMIKANGPVNVGLSVAGSSSTATSLRDTALQYGRRK